MMQYECHDVPLELSVILSRRGRSPLLTASMQRYATVDVQFTAGLHPQLATKRSKEGTT